MPRERRKSQAGNLSGGQQKMLQFALALLVRPRLCLIDEPTVGLAPKIAEEVYHWIEAFRDREGMTILLVEHNVRKVIETVRSCLPAEPRSHRGLWPARRIPERPACAGAGMAWHSTVIRPEPPSMPAARDHLSAPIEPARSRPSV